jgi:hypothetical protein
MEEEKRSKKWRDVRREDNKGKSCSEKDKDGLGSGQEA